jgi:undecaprenyl-diphosphatase
MTIINAIIYGIVQGIGEFLPISSSTHLAILPQILKINDPGQFFDLSMHLGTGISILVYFYRDILLILKDFFYFLTLQKEKLSSKHFLMTNLLIGTISTFLMVIILKKFGPKENRVFFFMALNLIFFGIVMGIADKFSGVKKDEVMTKDQWKKSFLVGIFQGLAIIPGVSRLGATLTICRIFKISRTESAKFSFLLSLPVVLGGFLLEFKGLPPGMNFDFMPIIVGGIVSFVFGLITLRIFIKYIEKIGLMPFTIYRIIFGAILLLSS